MREIADHAGSQAVVVSMDVKKNFLGKYEVFTRCGQKKTGLDPVKHAVEMEKMGAGEILINSIDRDGTMQGYDIELVRKVADAVNVPVVACGGAGNLGLMLLKSSNRDMPLLRRQEVSLSFKVRCAAC